MYRALLIVLICLTSIFYACSNPKAFITPGNKIILDQPNYKVGYSWTYDQHYPISCLTWNVETSDSPLITKLKCENNELHISSSNSLNLIKAINADGNITYSADPYWPHLSFPLYVGKCWDLSWKGKDPTLDWLWTAYTRACVVNYEKIEVPAGIFDAMRIEYEDNFKCCDGVKGYDKLITWYSPEAKTIIKFDSKRYPFWNHQLVSYNL